MYFVMVKISKMVPALQKKPSEINLEASDMWSFAILLWELATREVPFADLSPMEVGMKVCLHFLFLYKEMKKS